MWIKCLSRLPEANIPATNINTSVKPIKEKEIGQIFNIRVHVMITLKNNVIQRLMVNNV